MEDKIAVPEALAKYSRPAKDFMAPKRQKIEEKMREVPAKEKDGLYAIRVLTEQKLIVQKKITPVKEKILLTPDSPLISNLVSPDVSQGTDLAAFDPINSLSKQIQEYPQVSLKWKKMVEKLRAELPEKDAKIRELQAECEKSDRIIRDMIESNHRKNLELDLKLRSLKAKTKNVYDRISSFETVIQDRKERIETLEKKKLTLTEDYDKFIENFTK